MRNLSSTIFRFGVSGVLSTAAYFILVNALILGTDLTDTICSITAYLASLVLSYGLQSRYTFYATTDNRLQVSRFVITAVIGLSTATGLVYICNDLLGWPSLLGTAIVCVLIPAANFVAFRCWVFIDAQKQAQ
jgi:putative flippase GtrA